MRLVVLLLACSLSLFALDDGERDRLREELPGALSELAMAQQRLVEAAGTAGIQLPATVHGAVAARRTQGADWIRRIEQPGAGVVVEEIDAFRDGTYGLRGRLDQVTSALEQTTGAVERWTHAVTTSEFLRYRAFLRARIDQGLLEIAAGAEEPGDEEQHWRRQRRHELVLSLIDLAHQDAERWPLVAKDAPALRAYVDHRTALRGAAEAGLQRELPGDDRELDRDEGILWLLEELVQVAQAHAERTANREIPADAPLSLAYQAAIAAEQQAIQALIAHRRRPGTDEAAWSRTDEDLRRERERRGRLSGQSWELLELDLAISEQRGRCTEVLQDAPAGIRAGALTQLAAMDKERTALTAQAGEALRAAERAEVARVRSALRIRQRDYEALAEHIGQQREREMNEADWRTRAGEPGMAAALAKLDAAWSALMAARTRQVESEHAAIRADLARELAEIEAEESQIAADRSRRDLDQAQEALDLSRQQVADVLENPPPKPEGDSKF